MFVCVCVVYSDASWTTTPAGSPEQVSSRVWEALVFTDPSNLEVYPGEVLSHLGGWMGRQSTL